MPTRNNKKTIQERNKLWEENRKKLNRPYAWKNDYLEGDEKYFASEYGSDIQEFLWDELQKAITEVGDPCNDNYRHAKKCDPDSVARYEHHARQGCCGSHDIEVMAPNGEIYLLGFNYGH